MFLWMLPGVAESGSGNAVVALDGFMDPETIQKLELTPDQIRQLQSLKEAYVNDIGPLQNRFFSKKAEFRLFWKTSIPNRQECMDRQTEILMLYQQISQKTIQYQLDCRSLLTPEQESAWFQNRQERHP
jgi:Spy/CpxP family protein refolding chaperone